MSITLETFYFYILFLTSRKKNVSSDSQANSDSSDNEAEKADRYDVSTICRMSRLSSVSSHCLAQADDTSRVGQEDRTDRDSIVSSPARLSSIDG